MSDKCTILILVFLICGIIGYSFTKRIKSTDVKLQNIKEKLTQVDPRAKDIDFYTHPFESYALDKKEVHMCINTPRGDYYDDNILMYVGLHELAHILIPEDTSHHPPIFDTKFNELKDRAQRLNLFNPNFSFPSEYCGKKLSYY